MAASAFSVSKRTRAAAVEAGLEAVAMSQALDTESI